MHDQNKSPEQLADDYVFGLLSPEEAAMFEDRCEKDESLRRALDDAQKRKTALEAAPPVEASEKLVRDTMANIESSISRCASVWKVYSRTVLALAAAAACIIAIANFYYYNLKPSPWDVRILGQNEYLSGASSVLRVAVFNQDTGEQRGIGPGVVALVNHETGEERELGMIDLLVQKGAQITLPDWESGDYELRVKAHVRGMQSEPEVLTQTIRLTRSWKLMLSSDKPIYQPGQTIHLRSLALRKPDLKPVSGEEVTFTITDPKGNMIFKHRATGSKFGIAATDCPLATEIIEGPYNVECRIGDTSTLHTVKVEKYVLPKFNIGITLDKSFYAPGEQVTGTIQADYFFGQPVAKGDVKIDVRATDVQNFSIASIADTTNDKGQAKFNFTIPAQLFGREQDGGNARFMLVASVTDTAGQTYSRGTDRIVTSRPIDIDVIPEAGNLVKGVANKVYFFASYADGRPAADLTLNINGAEYTATTSDVGVAEVDITPKSDTIGMTISAKDKEGREGHKHVTLTVGQVADDFVVRTDKATYGGGDTMTLSVLGSGVEPVFVDLLKDGQTLLTTNVDMKDGKGSRELDLPPELFGTIKLVAYRFNKSGLALRKSRMIFVRQARELNVAALLDQDEYRPGVSAKLTLKLTDGEGKPAPGAISLAAVDEAVFAVLGQRPGMEEVFFLLEQELLEPIYAIYNWDPFADGASGTASGTGVPPVSEVIQLEQAIFSSTARVNQGYDAVPGDFTTPAVTGDLGMGNGDMEPGFMGADVMVEPAMAPAPMEVGPGDAQVRDNVQLVAAGDDSPFTLAAASYGEKFERITTQRNNGLAASIVAWLSLAGVLVLVGIATFAVYRPKAFLITSGICFVLFFLVGGSLFALMVVNNVQRGATLSEAFDNVAMAPQAEAMVAFGGMGGLGGGVWDDAMVESAPMEDMPMSGEDSGGSAPPRVREWFPETLLWKPEIVTDDHGVATLEVPLADSITTWRVTTSAVTADGQLGGGQSAIRVFQPFFVDLNLPVALTRNDQVSVPVVVYNYLDEPQTVELKVEAGDWFVRLDAAGAELADNAPLSLELKPREIRSLQLPLKVKKVGLQNLQVTATGAKNIGDAIKRQIEVVADGRRIEEVVNGSLGPKAEMTLLLPENVIEGSPRAIVKLYPTTFSQLVEGLDAIFQMPYGCFEQTSSTTYPNVLALDYLRRTKKNAPEVEAKAKQYINLGYQRLVSFEVDGGGFDWFGNPPANQTLTAYGLLEFEDMARVHDVDPALIERTRQWLLSKREADGRWKADPNMLNDGLASSVLQGEDLDLANTAYIAWAVFGSGKGNADAQVTLDYLLAKEPASIKSPYILAIIAKCIAGIKRDHSALGEYYARLDAMKETSEDGKQISWKQPEGARTMFYGSGQSGDVETTAMAALALLQSPQYSATVKGALTWLVAQKDARGTWYSTQATVLALKALIEGTSTPLGGEKPRKIDIVLGDKTIHTIDIPADQAEVMQQINLTEQLKPGEQQLSLIDRTEMGTGYQIAFWYNIDEVAAPPVDAPAPPLSVNISYDRERLAVDEHVGVKAIVVNNMETLAPMVILDLPIPGGFAIEAQELDELVGSKKIAKYQITARKAIVYLRALQPGEQLELNYRLKATMPVKVAVPAGEAYEYYDPAKRGASKPALLEATQDA